MQEVDGSSPFVPTKIADFTFAAFRGYSTVGSAIRSQRIGLGFESPYLHQVKIPLDIVVFFNYKHYILCFWCAWHIIGILKIITWYSH